MHCNSLNKIDWLMYTDKNLEIDINRDRRNLYFRIVTNKCRRNYGIRKSLFGSQHSNNLNRHLNGCSNLCLKF